MKQFFYIVTIIFTSCTYTEVVDFDNKYSEKVVLYSNLSPQYDTVRVNVSKTIPCNELFNYNSLIVENAKVTISGNDTSVVIPYNSNTKYYQIANSILPITPIQTYKVDVLFESGVSASAQITVPSLVNVEIDSVIVKQFAPYNYDDFETRYDVEVAVYLPYNGNNVSEYKLLACYPWYHPNAKKITYTETCISDFILEDDILVGRYSFSNSIYKKNDGDSIIINDYYPIYIAKVSPGYNDYNDYFQRIRTITDPGYFFNTYSGIYPEYTNVENGYGLLGASTISEPYYVYYK